MENYPKFIFYVKIVKKSRKQIFVSCTVDGSELAGVSVILFTENSPFSVEKI